MTESKDEETGEKSGSKTVIYAAIASNLGIAAATPRGLLVPNIKDAQDLSMKDLARAG